MNLKVGYIYKLEAHIDLDKWKSVVLLTEKDEEHDRYIFKELEIIWNGKKEEPDNSWDPSISYLKNNKGFKFTEVGSKNKHPEYFL